MVGKLHYFVLILLFGKLSTAQELIVSTSTNDFYLLEVDNMGNDDDDDDDDDFNTSSKKSNHIGHVNAPGGAIFYDIAIVDQKIYGISAYGRVYEIDIPSGSATVVGNFPNGIYTSLTSGGSGQLVSRNNSNKILYSLDLETKGVSFIANLNETDFHDMTYFNGRLVYIPEESTSMKALDMDDNTTTDAFCLDESTPEIYGLTTVYTGCSASKLFGVDEHNQFFEMNLNDQTMNEVDLGMHHGGSQVFGLATTSEYNALQCGYKYEAANCNVLATTDNEIVSLSVYPNPVQNSFSISGVKDNVKNIHVVDVKGKTVFKSVNSQPSYDISHLKRGIYMAIVTTDTASSTFKLVKS